MSRTWKSSNQQFPPLTLEKDSTKRKRSNKFYLPKIRQSFLRERKDVEVSGRAKDAADALQLTQHHLRKLKKRFEKIDIDKSGSIDHAEFYAMVGEKKSPLIDKLFDQLDIKSSTGIDFDSFVRVCLTYCSYSQEDILKFCFDCFDKDASGFIDEDEYVEHPLRHYLKTELCKTVNSASPMFPGNFNSAIELFDSNDDGYIDFYEFIEFHRRFPLVFFPAFRLQDRMQHKTLGVKSWIKVNKGAQSARRCRLYEEAHHTRKADLFRS